MNVLQLTVHFSPNVGGVETHLTDLVYGLAKKKKTVFVLTYRPLMTKVKWQLLQKGPSYTILRLPWIPGFFYAFVKNPIVEFLYLTPGLFIVTPFILLLKKSEVIHGHGLIAGFVGVFWGKFFEKKVILSTHSLYHFPSSGMYHDFAKWIFGSASTVLCLSNQSVNEIKKLGVPASRVKRFTYWVDTNQFSQQPVEKIKKELSIHNKFVVLFVGRLVAIKGIRELITASNLLPESVRILIAGDGPLQKEVETAAKESKKIIFLHALKNTSLPLFYNAADVVIVPSTHDEGFGRVILEALACGTPIIAARRGAIPEAMDESVGKLITVTPKNITQAITSLQKNKITLQKLKKNARSYALKRYSEKNIADILQAYEK